MKNKFILREIQESPKDIRFEWFKAIKTISTVLIIFCFGFIFRKIYFNIVENTENMRFYPNTTVFYQDSKNNFDSKFISSEEILSLSYGIFKDNNGDNKYLIVVKTKNNHDKALHKEQNYYKFSKGNYIFISDSEEELKKLPERIKHENYAIFADKNVRKLIKYLSNDRDYTILIADSIYSSLPLDSNTQMLLNKIFDKTIIQVCKTKNGIKFDGKITYKNQLADFATNIKNIQNLQSRKIKIDKFCFDKIALIIGVRDFDIWSNLFIKIAKTLSNNQYSSTIALIQTIFNTDVEEDIIKKLNGNAVLYAFNYKRELQPIILVETKHDLTVETKKYINFLQITNSIKLNEKDVNGNTLNILNSSIFPYNISFGSIGENTFILGYQNIVEKHIEIENHDENIKNSDIYLYSNLKKTPFFYKNKGFWNKYKTLEADFFISNFVTFSGTLEK